MKIVFVPGGFRFSSQVDAGVEKGLRACGHEVVRLCRDCLRTIGSGALQNVRAEVLLTVHGRAFPHRLLQEVDYPTVVWLVDEPQEVDFSQSYGRHFDMVITNDPNTIGVHGPHRCWYLPLAADPGVHCPGPADRERVDVSFVGGILPERARFLARLYTLTRDLSWRIAGPDRTRAEVTFADMWDRRSVAHREYAELTRSARIVLDVPRDEMVSFAGRTNRRGIPAAGVSTRVFETPACGSFLLTSDARCEIERLYPPGAVGIYHHGDPGDCAEQIRYYLEHEDEREEAAEVAYRTCLDRHTYTTRVRQLVEIIERWMETQAPAKEGSRR